MRLTYLSHGMLMLLLAMSQPALAQDTYQELDSLIRRHESVVVERLEQAARASHKTIDPRTVVELNGNGVSVVLGTTATLDDLTTATQPHGFDLAFGFFQLPRSQSGLSLPTGFYIVRMRTSQRALDSFIRDQSQRMNPHSASPPHADAQFEFVDVSGAVAARVPGAFGMQSPSRTGSSSDTGSTAIYFAVYDPSTFCIGGGFKWVCWGTNWQLAQVHMGHI